MNKAEEMYAEDIELEEPFSSEIRAGRTRMFESRTLGKGRISEEIADGEITHFSVAFYGTQSLLPQIPEIAPLPEPHSEEVLGDEDLCRAIIEQARHRLD
jgi:hypothetical protein